MQIKPTRRYCFIPTRTVTIIKTNPQITSIEKDMGKLVPLYIIDRKWKIFGGSSKIKHRIAYNLTIPLLRTENRYSNKHSNMNAHSSTIAKIQK